MQRQTLMAQLSEKHEKQTAAAVDEAVAATRQQMNAAHAQIVQSQQEHSHSLVQENLKLQEKIALMRDKQVEVEKENAIPATPPSPANSAKSLRERKCCPRTRLLWHFLIKRVLTLRPAVVLF